MVLNTLPMLKPSEIIDAKALIMAIEQQATLPTELQTEFHNIGKTLAADPNYIDRAIQCCIDLVASYPPLQAAFQSAGNSLNADSAKNRMGLPPQPIDPQLESSQEIANAVRDVCLAAGKQPQQLVGFWGRLMGKKSKIS
jgi:hypothetical protein